MAQPDPALKKFTDCFYYRSGACSKGRACEFRHCPTSLNTEAVCRYWLSTGCTNLQCSYQHPGGAKPKVVDRSTVPCYWLTQPSGCLKGKDCPFSHANAPESSAPSAVAPVSPTTTTATLDLPKRPPTSSADQRPKRVKVELSGVGGGSKSLDFGVKPLAQLLTPADTTGPKASSTSNSGPSSSTKQKTNGSGASPTHYVSKPPVVSEAPAPRVELDDAEEDADLDALEKELGLAK